MSSDSKDVKDDKPSDDAKSGVRGFQVTLEKIGKVYPHPNADKLECAKVENMAWQFIVKKGDFKAGDPVVYFPIDSCLPDKLSEKWGVKNLLVGPEKNRIKTAKLRGEISQGLVLPVKQVLGDDWETRKGGVNLAPELGITKYEPPEIPCQDGKLLPLPPGVSKYDIESCGNFGAIVARLTDKKTPLFITEKLEGTNFAVTRDKEGKTFVSQRQYTIQPIDGSVHQFWRVAKEQGLIDAVEALQAGKVKACTEVKGKQITIRGEFCGPAVQNNIYKLKKQSVFVFDILADGNYLSAAEFIGICEELKLQSVPILAKGVTMTEFLGNVDIANKSNGTSVLAKGVAREGIVIKPMVEEQVDGIGRLILKQRSPDYLAKSDF